MTLVATGALRGRCAVCGAPAATCGGPSSHHPIDMPRRAVMADAPEKLVPVEVEPGVWLKRPESEAKKATAKNKAATADDKKQKKS